MWVSDTEEGIAQAIIKCEVDFKRDPWPKVSDDANELVKGMLDPNTYTRMTVEEVLGTYFLVYIDNESIHCLMQRRINLNHHPILKEDTYRDSNNNNQTNISSSLYSIFLWPFFGNRLYS